MSTDTFAPVDSHLEEIGPYRAVSKAAVSSMALALLSFLYLFSPGMLVFPIAGVVCAIVALAIVRRYPQELTGRVPAWIAIGLSLVLLAGGSTLHAVTYVTEVPEGFERVTFWELQPDNPRVVVPPRSAKELDGKRVFVKGYVHPAATSITPSDMESAVKPDASPRWVILRQAILKRFMRMPVPSAADSAQMHSWDDWRD